MTAGLGWPTVTIDGSPALGWPTWPASRAASVSRETGRADAGPSQSGQESPAPLGPAEPVSRETGGADAGPAQSGQESPAPADAAEPVSRETLAVPLAAGIEETDAAAGVIPAATKPDVVPAVQANGVAEHAESAAPRPAADPSVSRETLPVKWPAPAERRTLTVANQKGGVGKTTTTVNLAAALAFHGLRVLVVDLDPQGNASTAFGIDHHAGIPSVYDVLVNGASVSESVTEVSDIPGLRCLPATIDLAGAEIELVSVVARESRLKRALDSYTDPCDFVLIDCPPSLGLLTLNAMVAGAEILIPIQCEFYALEGLSQLLRNIDLVKGHLNLDLHVSTILLTMYDARTRLADQVAAEVRTHFGDLVLESVIPRSVRISEAPGFGQTVVTYDPTSRGAVAYQAAAYDVARRSGGGGT